MWYGQNSNANIKPACFKLQPFWIWTILYTFHKKSKVEWDENWLKVSSQLSCWIRIWIQAFLVQFLKFYSLLPCLYTCICPQNFKHSHFFFEWFNLCILFIILTWHVTQWSLQHSFEINLRTGLFQHLADFLTYI